MARIPRAQPLGADVSSVRDTGSRVHMRAAAYRLAENLPARLPAEVLLTLARTNKHPIPSATRDTGIGTERGGRRAVAHGGRDGS
jgi:hypothetical protein